jgi:phosphatidate cytidylyltransferase
MADPAASPPDAPKPPGKPVLFNKELQLRVVSGLAVAAVALLAVYLGSIPFAILVFFIAAVMSWEWGGIVRGNGADMAAFIHIAAIAAAALLSNLSMAVLALLPLAKGAITIAMLFFGAPQARLSSLGVLYTGLPVVALGWLRADKDFGFRAVILILICVAITDTAAYFSGRLIGGPKLWPAVSPNKTWAGLIGGVSAAAIAAALFSRLVPEASAAWLAGLGLLLGLVAQGGDLAESALKRRFGRKDASDLIPGHGGFMDRMDGIVTASVAAALIALAVDAYAPGHALLHGT